MRNKRHKCALPAFAILFSHLAFGTLVPAAGRHDVFILHHGFDPDSVFVQPGDTVRWLHQDAAAHTVSGNGAEIWDSEYMAWGDVFMRVFTNGGSFGYVCNYHPMSGKVVVGGPSAIRPPVRDSLPAKLTRAPGAARDPRGRRLAREPSRHEAVIRSITRK